MNSDYSPVSLNSIRTNKEDKNPIPKKEVKSDYSPVSLKQIPGVKKVEKSEKTNKNPNFVKTPEGDPILDFLMGFNENAKEGFKETQEQEEEISKKRLGEKYIPPKSIEETQNLSTWDRLKHDFSRSLQSLGTKTDPLAKSLISGATLGKSEQFQPFQFVEGQKPLAIGKMIGEGYALNKLGGAFFPSKFASPTETLMNQTRKALNLPIHGEIQGGEASKTILKQISEKVGSYSKTFGQAAAVGAGAEAIKRENRGEGFNLTEMSKSAIEYGMFSLLVKGGIEAFDFMKALSPSQQSDVFIKGRIPHDLDPTSYKVYENKIAPEFQRIAEMDLKVATKRATEKADADFRQELVITKSAHEQELSELVKEANQVEKSIIEYDQQYIGKIEQIEAEHQTEVERIESEYEQKALDYDVKYSQNIGNVKAQHLNEQQEIDSLNQEALNAADQINQQYENKLSNLKAEHENELALLDDKQSELEAKKQDYEEKFQDKLIEINDKKVEEIKTINQEYKEAQKEFDKQKAEFEVSKNRQNSVEAAIQNASEKSPATLEGKNIKEGEKGITPKIPFLKPISTTGRRVGEVFAPQEIRSSWDAGLEQKAAVQASADSDHYEVQKLYNENEKLNKKIEIEHPTLYGQLIAKANELKKIEVRSSPQEAILKACEKIANSLVTKDKEGKVIGYKKINNKDLLNQGKALRKAVDYDFAQANPSGEYFPVIDDVEGAAYQAAIRVGNKEAKESNIAAKEAYRLWTETYQNDYIRSLRDSSNQAYAKTFENSLNVDNFSLLDNVLQRSNAGQQLAQQTKRELVLKELEPFIENPKNVNPEKLDRALRDLSPILRPEEIQGIRQALAEARRTVVIQGKKVPSIEEPIAPKKPVIKPIKFPIHKPPSTEVKRPSKVKLPAHKPPEVKLKEIKEVKIPEYKGPKKPELPEKPKLPEYKPPKKEIKFPEKVSIPSKAELAPTPEMKKAADYLHKNPTEIRNMMDSREGIKEFRTQMTKTTEGSKLYRRASEEKLKDIIHRGKVQHEIKGNELYETLNNKKNYELIEEIMGEDVARDMRESAHILNKKYMRRENILKFAKKTAWLKTAIIFGIF